ncbi:hypothetical protein TVAG_001580 [Trichomonas vaginalis G3]|uniref:RRM domain-containing protein n=1 Tax=Trichomonas vaginalis (strain ATCC PRA-98 / G3) TaxID=412133 RepID=A2FSW7_TRIV3|nr:RNA binding [Trichomonas vaginalis G3]EAX91989.1 hypothetical protein TVAG_001580 [Trichomonas vaginalis G3]KAI5528944.1 RNA binding [Trichomonas vaginalis G3]|eukprot:XP_001304919.1 hypothetical protein [Trichomonas vaginalis G3]
MFSDDWGDFVQTPPQMNSFVQLAMQDSPDIPSTILPIYPSFMPRSPSLPTFLSQDPTSTLEFLGLETPSNEKEVIDKRECPEIESRTIIIKNLPENVSLEFVKGFIPTTVPMKSVQKIQKKYVLIEFFDLRHAQYFRHHLDKQMLTGVPMEVRYSPPPPNSTPSQKPPNNGTIVLFHLDPSITNTQLESIFCSFGEIRQIRGTPSKPSQRFIEYWDTRCAQTALKTMNGKMLLGTKISIEFSIPGGLRKNFTKQRFT